MNKLAEYAIQMYTNAHKYLQMVLKDFPLQKITEKIGEAKPPAEILFHAVATSHWWMKQNDRGFDFRAQFETPQEAIDLWDKQLEVFKELLKDEKEWHYTPRTSIPWIMIRTSNHLVHHLGMIIYARHYHGLPALEPLDGFGWGTMVDTASDLHYG